MMTQPSFSIDLGFPTNPIYPLGIIAAELCQVVPREERYEMSRLSCAMNYEHVASDVHLIQQEGGSERKAHSKVASPTMNRTIKECIRGQV